MKRVIFYFDGFNFYNGLREQSLINPEWRNYYWLDFVKFCKTFLGESHSLEKVKYFTAAPSNDKKRGRQSALFNANRVLNGNLFEIINGKYQQREMECRAHCKQIFSYPEEKRTDVSISVNMLLDCYHNRVDNLVLISADSDQIPTIQAIKETFVDKNVKIYFPPCRNSADLFNLFKPVVYLSENELKFKKSILPGIINEGNKKYSRPESWRH